MSHIDATLADAEQAEQAERAAPAWRRIALVVLALAGMGVSGYLVFVRYTGGQLQCFGLGGCEEVSASRWGEIVLPFGGPGGLHIPVSLLGLGLYLVMLALVLVAWRLPDWERPAGLALFGLAFAGVLYSAYLTYVELFVLYKICPWCVASAAIVTAMWLLAWPAKETGDV